MQTPPESFPDITTYHRSKTAIGVARFIVSTVGLGWVYFSGISRMLEQVTAQYTSLWCIHVAFYGGIALCVAGVCTIPFAWLEGYWLEKKFQRGTASAASWWIDFCKEFAIDACIGCVLLECLYFFLRVTLWWWMWMWAVYFLLAVVLAKIAPDVIIPLFFTFKPLEHSALQERVNRLAEYFCLPAMRVWVVDFSRKTKKANAFVAGWGGNKRVAFADNLINNYTLDEIEAVVAHEFAHIKHRDALKHLCVAGIGSLGVCAATAVAAGTIVAGQHESLSMVRTLPLILLLAQVCVYAVLPVHNWFSRRVETAADASAIAATGNPDGFVALMNRLAADNLAEKEPPVWKEIMLYSHPAINRRIARAREYGKNAE